MLLHPPEGSWPTYHGDYTGQRHSGLTQTVPAQIELLKRRVAEEYEVFSTAVADWTHLREQWLADAKRAVLERWERSQLQSRLQEVEHKLKIQYQRMRVLDAQIAFTVA